MRFNNRQIRFLLLMLVTNVAIQAQEKFPRVIKTINSDWFFIQKDSATTKKGMDANDGWQSISIPHNWGYEEAQKGNNNFYKGIGWYAKEITINPKKGKRYFLKFEAASSVANVYINDKYLGEHRGSFSAFSFEITKYLSKDNKNIISVKVSNKTAVDIAPTSGDFNIYGGLYRSVQLIETADVCFDVTDYASPGVKWLQTKVTAEKAVIDIKTLISNGTNEGIPFSFYPKELNQVIPEGLYTLKAKLIDAKGTIVTTVQKDINSTAHLTIPFSLKMTVENPHLWQGVVDPYLYSAVIELYQKDNLIDLVEQKIGLRSFYIDPDKGFFLNNKPYKINGVAKHQDRQDKGWAVTNADLDQDVALIREMGANALRCAHYQHSDYLMDLCDKTGLLVWAELPQVATIRENPEFIATTRNQLLDLIRQNINHSSIFTWSLFNELRVEKYDPHKSLMDLQILAKGEDPTRPTIAATSHGQAPEMLKIPDLLGWNRYPGWYDPYADLKNDTIWDKYQPTSNDGGICVSEYGAGANIEHHEQNPSQPLPAGFWHPEEWQSIAHEAALQSFNKKPYIWGTFVWNMFDFSAARRREGGKEGMNDKGLVTFDRKIKKDAFYFYKANWSQEPVLHLTSKRHLVRDQEITPIKAYSNLGTEIHLSVNGKNLGSLLPDDYKIIEWKNVKLKKGKNKIVISTVFNKKTIKDEVVWDYNPNFKSLKPDETKKERKSGDGGMGQ